MTAAQKTSFRNTRGDLRRPDKGSRRRRLETGCAKRHRNARQMRGQPPLVIRCILRLQMAGSSKLG
jgi:hypothetical protein